MKKIIVALFLLATASAAMSASAAETKFGEEKGTHGRETNLVLGQSFGAGQNGTFAASLFAGVTSTSTFNFGDAEVRPAVAIKIGMVGAGNDVGAELQGLVRFNSNPSIIYIPTLGNTNNGVETGFGIGTEFGNTLVKFGVTRLEQEVASEKVIYQVSFMKSF